MLNNVVLIGRLTKDPELKQTGNGRAFTNITLAVNRNFRNAQGETEADFINVVAWQKTAELICNFLGKGRLVAVNGRIQTRNYENEQGQRIYITEVVAENVQFLDRAPNGQNGQNQGSNQNSYQNNNQGSNQNSTNQYQNQNQNQNQNNNGGSQNNSFGGGNDSNNQQPVSTPGGKRDIFGDLPF